MDDKLKCDICHSKYKSELIIKKNEHLICIYCINGNQKNYHKTNDYRRNKKDKINKKN